MFRLLLTSFFLFAFWSFAQEKRMTLHDWKFRLDLPSGNLPPAPEYPATVPGVIHLDLVKNNLAPDFYAGFNEQSELAKELELQNWIYSTTFELTEKDLQQQHIDLVFEGLDTYAKIYLNDSLLLSADNMFRTWTIPVKNHLKTGTNRLRVHFTSPLNYHRETVQKAAYELPSGNESVDLKVAAYTRKAAYHFGWDWGPRFVTCGIWRPCYIRMWNDFRVSDVYVQTKSCSAEKALLNIQFNLESDFMHARPFYAQFKGTVYPFFTMNHLNHISFDVTVDKPQLWFPNGHGTSYIYSDTLVISDDSTGSGFLNYPVSFGIRTVELVNEKDSIGTTFYFKVNGKPIFMKGANYIPQDLFLPRVTHTQTENLLQTVQESGMNMLRVWGGGIYESDFFYTKCDELGILVWQDFMFANSMYPANAGFHKNIAAEIEDNVTRLRNHPCIALWCGNNEIEVAWHNWGWQKQYGYSAKDSTEIWANYKTVFHQLIPDKLKALDPSRAYIPSSPQSNWGKAENFNHGAMHYWGVWHGKEPIENFKTNVGRFMVEYGFQSYPNADLLLKYLSPADLNFDSDAFKNLQKSYIGNGLIQAEVETCFGEINTLSEWLYATQYVQAQALKAAIIAHRLKAPHCMGTLFWQLNDCWPGASWSILEYNQDKKVSFFEVEKWFSPTIAVLEKSNDSLRLTVHSDCDFAGTVTLNVCSESTGQSLKMIEIPCSLASLQTQRIWALPLKKFTKKQDLKNITVGVSIRNEEDTEVFSDLVRFRKLRIDEIH
ncbi:MAG: glycoside hydrolase family 2 protein [Bacteroidetes bacterium]|nr:glycoside hydrolase family 2 protein [Bacteroidota bacterium]